jgi:hypothetical protein
LHYYEKILLLPDFDKETKQIMQYHSIRLTEVWHAGDIGDLLVTGLIQVESNEAV